MAAPAVHPTTLAVYGRLPEFYRLADAELDWPLLRFLSLLGDQLGELADLLERIDYVGPDEGGEPGDSSDLVDPSRADDAWLGWLAQLVGVKLAPRLTPTERRDAVLYASAGWRAGTKTGVGDAAKSVLTGDRYARIYPQQVPAGDGLTLADGGQWDLTVVTRTSETPSPELVLDTVVAKGAKPAGVVLHHLPYSASWAQIEALGSWAAVEARGSWRALEETAIGG